MGLLCKCDITKELYTNDLQCNLTIHIFTFLEKILSGHVELWKIYTNMA